MITPLFLASGTAWWAFIPLCHTPCTHAQSAVIAISETLTWGSNNPCRYSKRLSGPSAWVIGPSLRQNSTWITYVLHLTRQMKKDTIPKETS